MTLMTATAAARPGGTTTRTQLWAGRILTGVFTLFMVFDVTIKLLGLPAVDETMARMGWPQALSWNIGLMELVFVALYLHPRTALLGAVLMTGLLGGAVATHVRIADPLFSHVLFGVYLGAVMWGGLLLRDVRLRGLFPIAR